MHLSLGILYMYITFYGASCFFYANTVHGVCVTGCVSQVLVGFMYRFVCVSISHLPVVYMHAYTVYVAH